MKKLSFKSKKCAIKMFLKSKKCVKICFSKVKNRIFAA